MSGRASFQSVTAANKDTFGKLYKYSIAMFLIGLGTFFLMRQSFVTGALGINEKDKDTVSALAGVLATNLVIGAYVYDAYVLEDVSSTGSTANGKPSSATKLD